MNRSSRGFTLLEVLVALVIFALVSVTCYRQIDANFRASNRIEQKYLALWLAENALEEIFIDREHQAMGDSSSEVKMASNRWTIKTRISESDIKDLRKIEVSVYPDDKDSSGSVVTLTRFIGKK